jgi:hypothetical protein
MAQRVRPVLHLRLSSLSERGGEIPLSELSKVAQNTQRVISRLAQGLIDDLGPGNLRHEVTAATELFLIGLRPGSTVLDIAGPELSADTLSAEGMPTELRDMAMTAFVESLEALSQARSLLPLGVDEKAVRYIDEWLRSVRHYDRVAVDAELPEGILRATVVPSTARKNLRKAETQPSLPYVSADHQVLTGRLYALNLRTGTFSVEDGAGHSIRLSVPADMRDEAAQLINRWVRAVGTANLDSTRRRLISFDVVALIELPDLGDQTAFFKTHDLAIPSGVVTQDDLSQGVISDWSDNEIDAFVDALRAE